ncbi:MAG: FAD-dependent oxidoreductase [Desulfatiglans sp.]|jgi:Fe-S oxidoreductase|nr:FAD-dependent oxidoreductase [Desulfatiglans sp.]
MKLEESRVFVNDCFSGEPASCSYACPFGLDIRFFMERVKKGRWIPAYKTFRDTVLFPVIVSRLCPQPCRNNCQRPSIGDEPLAVRDLEYACTRYALTRRPENFVIPPKKQHIAIIGGGPAGLSCALNLAQKKFHVTIFEKETGWGGALRSHPDFKLFDDDITLQFSATDALFEFNREIGSLDTLTGFDAIYVATGKNGATFGLMDSHDSDLMTTSRTGVFMGGALCGVPLMESIAQGSLLARIMEGYFETGKAALPDSDRVTKNRVHFLNHSGEENKALVTMTSPEGYTEGEAKAEASRCFLCDCRICWENCEMIKWFRKMPPKLGVEVYTDSQSGSSLSKRSLTRETYSCNICGKCKSVCPVGVDVGALMQFSREDRLRTNKNIPAFHDFWIGQFDFHTSEAFFVSPSKKEESCEYLFFPGCQLGAAEPDHVLKPYNYLQEKFNAGIMVGCCGAPAYWAGDKKRLADNIERIRSIWNSMERPTLIFACAYCENIFRLLMPEIKQESLYTLMAKDDSIVPARLFESAAMFDPCTARDDKTMQEGVRILAGRAGVAIEELDNPNRCCGYGGHMRLANPGLYEEITKHRNDASDKPYIVYCANCREVFRQKGKECAHILDMVYDIDLKKCLPTLKSQKENALEVKKKLMKRLTGDDFIPEKHEWDSIRLIISVELQDELDRKLIIEDDLKEAIWLAKQTGERFLSDDGVIQCSMVKSVLTYWVQYKELKTGEYEIRSAYIHRMKFNREG